MTPEGIKMFWDLFKLSRMLRFRVAEPLFCAAVAWPPTGGILVMRLPIGDIDDEFCYISTLVEVFLAGMCVYACSV